MNLNKLLCKYLDRDNKGHVTAGDLMTTGMIAAIAILLIVSAVQGAIIAHDIGIAGAITTEFPSLIEPLCVLTFLLVALLVVFVIGSTLLGLILCTIEDIWETKIATCERKDGDDE